MFQRPEPADAVPPSGLPLERDPAALADASAETVEDRDRRARMSLAAREHARDYTWERYGERLVAASQALAG
jgi:glycosyltransferase involved in cell wall biosynthesis